MRARRIAYLLVIASVCLSGVPAGAAAAAAAHRGGTRALLQVSWTESSPRPGAGNRAAAHAVEAPKAHAPADKATAAPVHEDDGKKSSLSVYSDSTFLPGTTALRTTMTRSSGGAAFASQAAQDAARAGDTSLTATAATSWQSGKQKSERLNADLAAMDTQAALQSKGANEASRVAKSNVGTWAAGSHAQTSAGFRASMSNDATAAAIRNALDHPKDAFRATATGSEQASSVTWEASTAAWE